MIRPKQHMERPLYNKIVEEIGRESPKTEVWPTFYGEAFILGDELWDRLNHAHNAGCENLVLNSNGTLLGRDNNIDKVLRSPLKRFILSLDGLKPETFEKIREKAKFDVVYPAVETLLEERARRGQTYPTSTCQFSVMADNASECDDYHAYWTSRGAEVKIRPMLEWTASGTVRSGTISHNSDFRIACPWGNNTMAIHQDGSVVACAVDYEGLHKVGNASTSTLVEMWAELKRTLRDIHRQHRWKDLPSICKGCGDWQTAGAEYEPEKVEGTRPFWFKDEEMADDEVPALPGG
jgi:radical SAM protein with 4Fe4S-binding SPASM domain